MSRKLTLRYVHCNRGDLFHIPRRSSPLIEIFTVLRTLVWKQRRLRENTWLLLRLRTTRILFCSLDQLRSIQIASHTELRISSCWAWALWKICLASNLSRYRWYGIKGFSVQSSALRQHATKRLVIYFDGIQTSERSSGPLRHLQISTNLPRWLVLGSWHSKMFRIWLLNLLSLVANLIFNQIKHSCWVDGRVELDVAHIHFRNFWTSLKHVGHVTIFGSCLGS